MIVMEPFTHTHTHKHTHTHTHTHYGTIIFLYVLITCHFFTLLFTNILISTDYEIIFSDESLRYILILSW